MKTKLLFLTLLLPLVFGLSGCDQAAKLREAHQKLEAAQLQINQLKEENEKLQSDLEYVKSGGSLNRVNDNISSMFKTE